MWFVEGRSSFQISLGTESNFDFNDALLWMEGVYGENKLGFQLPTMVSHPPQSKLLCFSMFSSLYKAEMD